LPLDLRQRLSEFSYGYGVTREVQTCLETVGLRTVPFLPSLIHEAEIGCDVHFGKPGIPLLLQFKLGHELKQYRRSDLSKPAPKLNRPFWRFEVDTSEEDGQYDLLLKAEQGGAEVYYIAPRFADWDDYAAAFQDTEVLERSLLMKPSEIDRKLRAEAEPDGLHKIVYDKARVYVCSEPRRVDETRAEQFATSLRTKLQGREEPISHSIRRVFENFGARRDIRRESREQPKPSEGQSLSSFQTESIGRTAEQIFRERRQRLDSIRRRSKTENDAIFSAVGVETWAAGSQLIAVTVD